MALFTLTVFSAVAGIVILWIFKLTSNQHALKATRRRVMSHLLAMRLYSDDLRVTLRSQLSLLAWNARYMALLVPPFLAVAIPLFFAWDHLDGLWGRAPFVVGDTAIVTARVRGSASGAELVAPAWLAVESPAVRALADDEVSWRVRVQGPGSGEVSVHVRDGRISMPVVATPGLHLLSERAKSSSGPLEWVSLRYPRAELSVFGFSASWIVWFCLISTAAALLLRGRLRVTF